MYENVCKWTKNVDIFDMDYILIPIHDTAHWSLAVVCHPGKVAVCTSSDCCWRNAMLTANSVQGTCCLTNSMQ